MVVFIISLQDFLGRSSTFFFPFPSGSLWYELLMMKHFLFLFFLYYTTAGLRYRGHKLNITYSMLIAIHLNRPYVYDRQSIFKLQAPLGIIPVHILTLSFLLSVSQCGTVRLSFMPRLFRNVPSMSLPPKPWPPWPFFLLRHDYISVHQILSIPRALCDERVAAWTCINSLNGRNRIQMMRNGMNNS